MAATTKKQQPATEEIIEGEATAIEQYEAPASTALVTTTEGFFSREQVELIKTQICRGATDGELKHFLNTCKVYNLNPLARQIYAVFRSDYKSGRDIMTIQVSVDGLRVIAERSGKYQGQEGPWWCGDDAEWKEVWLDSKPPKAAKIHVLRKGFIKPISSVALWSSYRVLGRDKMLTPMWEKMPDLMLAKAAESLALRRAFPAELSGLYSSEEMEQAGSYQEATITEVIDFKTKTRKTGSEEERHKFIDAIRELGIPDQPTAFKLLAIDGEPLSEWPYDRTFGELLDALKTKLEEGKQ